MARFGDLEAAIMDVVWAAGTPVRVREVAERLNRDRPLAFNTVQTVMEILYRKGWLARSKDGRAYLYVAGRTRDEYAAGLLAEALSEAPDPAATLVRLVSDLEPGAAARLRAALDAAADREPPR
ncbi:MAG TPA: BlaI/MecI/CopY family transcriptional regulator [Streptosporangiaceae bacterium]|nr:BlaI/MecI/CopY family transcriptional regulator [Streptosporangiaceae bacterium]